MVVVADGEGDCSAPASAAAAALRKERGRSHSEAERKRRQRINAHLATLRAIVPSASRMDKAALLGEVVRYVRELRAAASDAAEGAGVVVPGEGDELGVVEQDNDDRQYWRPDHHCDTHGAGRPSAAGGDPRRRPRRVRAWVCCADRPGLMSDLGRAVRSVGNARAVRAEVATVGGRTRSVLELEVCDDDDSATAAATGDSGRVVALSTLRAALRTVLLSREEHPAAAEGYSKRPCFSGGQIATVQ